MVLGVDPVLDRVALDPDVVLGEGQFLASSDPDLPADDVDVRHLLGGGVLDLDPGVDLHEVELAIFDEELHGPSVRVACLPDPPAGGVADLLAQFLRERRTRRLLDHFLVAPLQRAVPLAEMADVAVLVGEDLDLDVLGCFEVLLDVHRVVVEVGFALALCRLQRVVDVLGVVDDLHATTAAAALCLDRNGVAELLTDLPDLLR